MSATWLPAADAAVALGCSVRTVERRIAAGRLDTRPTGDGRREVLVDVAEPPVSDGQASAAAVVAVADQADRQVALALGSAQALTRAAQDDAARARSGSRRAWSAVGVMVAGVVVATGLTTRAVTLAEARIDAQAHQLAASSADADALAGERDALRRDLDATRVTAAVADARLAAMADTPAASPSTRPALADALALLFDAGR